MSIDLFTFIVQIINFLLLLFILGKFLYKPIMNMIKNRQDYIKNTIEEVENKLQEAEKAKSEYREELDKIDQYRQKQKEKIDKEFLEYKEQKTEELKAEVDKIREEFLRQFDNDKSNIADSIVKSILASVSDFLVDTFVSLSNNSLENAILAKFIDEVDKFPNDVIDRINKAEEKQIKFISSFELSEIQKNTIKKSFLDRGVNDKEMIFIEDESIILGNKVIIGSLTINSNIRNIIDQFQNKLEQIM